MQTKRANFIFIAFILAFLVLIGYSFYLQILNPQKLIDEGEKRQTRLFSLAAKRGTIYDRNGAILAISEPVYSIFVNPFLLTSYQRISKDSTLKELYTTKYKNTLAVLAEYLNQAPSALENLINANKERKFLYLKRNITPDKTTKITQANLFAIYLKKEYKRFYPPSATALIQLLGITDTEGAGLEAIEKAYNTTWLNGIDGLEKIIKTQDNKVAKFISTIKKKKNGKDITLSLDKEINLISFNALKKAYDLHLASAASAVILDVKTGEIIANNSIPTFNPNNRNNIQQSEIRNRVIADVFEPGSSAKSFIVAAAFDKGLVTPETQIYVKNGAKVGDAYIKDNHNFVNLSVADILRISSNVGIIKIAQKLDKQDVFDTMTTIGFNQPSLLKLNSENQGYVVPFNKWQNFYPSSIAYGYGFSINLLQLARAYSILANKGNYHPVTFFKVTDINKVKNTRVFKEQTANDLMKILTEAVDAGTGKKAQIPGIKVAGKTGTARIVKKNGQYSIVEHNSFFVGIIPADNPKYVMAIYLNKPSRGFYYGSDVAAQVFHDTMARIFLK